MSEKKDCKADEFRGIVSVLRYFIRTGRSFIVDRFASAANHEIAFKILHEMFMTIDREAEPGKEGKIRVRVRKDDAERLNALYKVDVEPAENPDYRYVVVNRPRRPSEDELRRFEECLKSEGMSLLHKIAVYAYAIGRRGGRA